MAYSSDGNLDGITHKKSGGTIIDSFEYGYDDAGNRTTVTENGGATVTWGYDDAYRLKSEARTGTGSFTSTFTYDDAGNRKTVQKDGVTTTFNYDMADQITTSVDSGGTSTYTYDGAGNQTLVVAPGSQKTTSTWNDGNKRTQVKTPTTTTDSKYRYDGLRFEKQDSSGTTKFIYDGPNYFAETNSAGTVQAAYTVAPNGESVSRRTVNSVYFHSDAIGSVRVLTTTSQIATATYAFSAWGDEVASTGIVINPFRWFGLSGYFDEGSADYLARDGIYSTFQGRMLSIFGFTTTLIAANNPVSTNWNRSRRQRQPIRNRKCRGRNRGRRGGRTAFGRKPKPCGKPAMCGPDVTPQVTAVLTKLKTTFATFTPAKQDAVCSNIFGKSAFLDTDPNTGTTMGINAWDINQLHVQGWINAAPYSPPCALPSSKNPLGCQNTVEVSGGCYYAGSVNYVVYGHLATLCGISRCWMQSLIDAYKGPVPFYRDPSPNWLPSKDWADAGFDGWPTPPAATPAPDRAHCPATCPVPYAGIPFTIYLGGHGRF
ncbi:RHS repeat domain-containing protein [Planctomycetota bacterium]